MPAGTKIPNHIAMILDGNRRWARARGLQPWEGHKAGYEAVQRLARASRKLGVHTFTVWAFSTENWDRPAKEIEAIFHLLRKAIADEEEEFHRDKVRFVHLGRKDRFPEDIAKGLAHLEEATAKYEGNVFNLALDYGGRDEIVRAVNKIQESRFKNQDSSPITEKEFESYLDTATQPYPYVDLFIRTSGEQRTSGLLPWQMTYAEMYWETDHLPDFTPEKLKEAILDYSRRRRRFGGDDRDEHLKFNPKVVARLELDWRRALNLGEDKKLRDLVVAYLKEQYGLSKELAVSAGVHMAGALLYGKDEDWAEAKKALVGLYEIVRKNVGLAMEPEIVADLQLKLWQKGGREEDYRQLYAETYRFSDLQAAKSAHLAYLANTEMDKNNYKKAKDYLERFYAALKERVA